MVIFAAALRSDERANAHFLSSDAGVAGAVVAQTRACADRAATWTKPGKSVI
jgi:hypothetical protein